MLLDEVVERSFPGEELEEEDAEAVYVGVRGEGAGSGVAGLRGAVEEGGGGGEVVVVVGGGEEPRDEAVVCEAGLEVGTQKDVGGLEVTVDDWRGGLVEVDEAGGHVLRDLKARRPMEGLPGSRRPRSCRKKSQPHINDKSFYFVHLDSRPIMQQALKKIFHQDSQKTIS